MQVRRGTQPITSAKLIVTSITDKEVGAAVLHGDDNDNDDDDNESTPEVNTITASDAPLDSIKGEST